VGRFLPRQACPRALSVRLRPQGRLASDKQVADAVTRLAESVGAKGFARFEPGLCVSANCDKYTERAGVPGASGLAIDLCDGGTWLCVARVDAHEQHQTRMQAGDDRSLALALHDGRARSPCSIAHALPGRLATNPDIRFTAGVGRKRNGRFERQEWSKRTFPAAQHSDSSRPKSAGCSPFR
jgi:hypothetical protein